MSQRKMGPLSADAGAAHVLYAQGKAELNVVFVHGFMGDSLETWTWRPSKGLAFWRRPGPSAVLPDLLAQAQAIPCHYYSVAHSASATSPTDIERAAGVIRTFIENHVLKHAAVPVVLVAHSFGGLACRQAILDMLEHDRLPTVVGLLMLGTPNAGAEIARLPGLLGSGSGNDMRPFNDTLAKLNREWARRVVNGGDPDLEAHRRAPVLCWAAVGTEDGVVTGASAGSLASFADIKYLNKSHLQLPKAADIHDPTVALLTNFIGACRDFARRREGEWAVRTLTHRLRKASLDGHFVRRETLQIALRASDLPHRYACRVVEQREGGTLAGRFTVCAWCPGQAPDIPIEFDWEIGHGTMDAAAFDRMVQQDTAALDQYFHVASLEIGQDGRQGALLPDGKASGPGWHAWHFRCPDWFDPARPYEVLRVEVETFTDDRQGWMFYSVRRTVSECLDVSFCAPFRFSPLVRLGFGTQLTPITPVGGSFVSRALVKGPVAMGRMVVWIYDRAGALAASTPSAAQPAAFEEGG